MLDDHTRLFVASRAYPTVKAADVVDAFRMAVALHGAPVSLLCDSGAVCVAAVDERKEPVGISAVQRQVAGLVEDEEMGPLQLG